jgi:hypothetical protein
MSTVVEIEKALQTLPVQDARKTADWLQHYLDEKWDRQIDRDIAAGRLDKLADKAMQDHREREASPVAATAMADEMADRESRRMN